MGFVSFVSTVHEVDVVVSEGQGVATLVVEIEKSIEVEMVTLGAARMSSRTWSCPGDDGVSGFCSLVPFCLAESRQAV